jgi:hypothetical protein
LIYTRFLGRLYLDLQVEPDGSLAPVGFTTDNPTVLMVLPVLHALLHLIGQDLVAVASFNAGSCAFCERGLTDPVSRAIGIGPECRARATPDGPEALMARIQRLDFAALDHALAEIEAFMVPKP